MKNSQKIKSLLFLIPMLILLTMSLLLMYHAKYITGTYKYHFIKQSIWILIGISLVILIHHFKPSFLFRYSKILYYLSLFLLVLVLLIGENINGSKAWINLKFILFQPSELMKLSYSLYLSKLASTKRFYNAKQELLFLGQILILFLIPSILVFLEPDTGAILFYFFITVTILYGSNLRKRWIISLGILFLLVLLFFCYAYFFQKDFLISLLGTSIFYRMERILNIGEGMQIKHALIALGSAPILQFNLTQTGIYIPESPTDFIFSLTSNVFGILGNYLILLSYLIMNYYLLHRIKNMTVKEQKSFSQSFLSIFIPSQILNIGMNLGILPIMGIPLPFLSYGGSSTIVLFLYLAIIFMPYKKEFPIETLEIPTEIIA